MSAASQFDALNAPQKKAATFGQVSGEKGWRCGPLLIIAGAGTGKTSTLAHRVAQQVVSGVDPGKILLLTFTRRAAAELRRRVHDIVR
jgi:DNA helicase-2/ATP-dependent DNA helicase PcrA